MQQQHTHTEADPQLFESINVKCVNSQKQTSINLNRYDV